MCEHDEDVGEGICDEEIFEEETVLDLLRQDLIDELKMINQYEEHLAYIEDEILIKTLKEIVLAEKEHVAKLMYLINSLDPEQMEKFKSVQ
ncbi:MAG: hypothetical protein DDT22_01347 [candidate division WS2 bacterium]|nr:hypothetical protein [Candidatus Lithacetigena glycinireducens]